MGEYHLRVLKFELKYEKKPARNPPKTHLNIYVSAFRKFVEIAGIPYLIGSDLAILHVEAKDWERFYQRPSKQAEKTPVPILESCEKYVSEYSRDLPGGLFAWPFAVAVVSCLRRDGMISDAPSTTVLMKEGLIWSAAKSKTRGESGGRPWGAGRFAFSNGKVVAGRVCVFQKESGDLSRYFWIGWLQVIESELGFSTHPCFLVLREQSDDVSTISRRPP